MALNTGDKLANGQYRILGQLGHGGFGFVYEAEDTLMNETVAIKELIPGLIDNEVILKRFIQQARASLRLTHPNIVRIYNVFADRGNYYIVMEYLPGGSLKQWGQQRGTVGVEQAIGMLADVCAGLEYAHEKGIVHCDIKPGNVLFAADGMAKVADSGMAHVSEELMTRSWQSVSGFAAGTMLYIVPEQLDGVRDDPRVDIYALGAMLYQMLAGQPYLDSRLPARTISDQMYNASQIKERQPLSPSAHNRAIPGWLDTVILKALAKQPVGRYKSAAALKAALARQAVAEPSAVAAPTPKPTPVPRPKQRWPVHPAAITGALAALAMAVGIILLSGCGGPATTPVPPAVNRIAFVSDRDGNPEIYMMNADGSEQTRLTNNPGIDSEPSWSPDATRIAFDSTRDGNGEIYVMNADGSRVTRLTDNPANDYQPSWSPDGKRIAFTSYRNGPFAEIYVMKADGSEQMNLTNNPANDYQPSWSPDGKRIAFVSTRYDYNPEICVMNADGSEQMRLTNSWVTEEAPSWSPDGMRIAFVSEAFVLMPESGVKSNREIYVMNVNGSGQTNLTDNPVWDWHPSWSPDGTRIAFYSERDGNWEIYVMNADGSGVTRLTDNPARDYNPSWSPR